MQLLAIAAGTLLQASGAPVVGTTLLLRGTSRHAASPTVQVPP